MRQADSRRLDRLAGDGNGEAGIDLASLFRIILDQVQDSAGGVDTAAFTAPVQEAVSNRARVEHWYGARAVNPWDALITDALEQLESRKLLVRDGDKWRLGPASAPGRRLIVVPARQGRHGAVGVVPRTAAERETLGLAEKQRMEITSLAASLREDGPGLRPLDAEHVAVLEQSMRDYGYRPEFPVLVDRHGRILDGRHRIAAARRAGIAEPLPQREVTVTSDAEAVGLAILMNLQRGWTKAERNRIDSDLRAAGLTVENFGRQLGTSAKREVIRAALLEFPTLTHRAIAKRLELDHKQADRVCAELVDNGTLSHCEHRLTEEGKQAPGQKPKAPTAAETRVEELLLENPQRSNAQIRAAAGLSANQHRIVERARDRLETAAAIPVITAREGRDGTIRRLPHDGTPSPSATASHADAEGSWTTIMERLGRLSDLWRNGPPQATSELTELEALHREIGERIAVLRG